MRCCFRPFRRPARQRRSQCSNNLKQLGLALHNYHDSFQAFPAVGYGRGWAGDDTAGSARDLAEGPSVLNHNSWVSLAPFYEQGTLYDRYNFSVAACSYVRNSDRPVAGDAAVNAPVTTQCPAVFQCPSDGWSTKVKDSSWYTLGSSSKHAVQEQLRLFGVQDGQPVRLVAEAYRQTLQVHVQHQFFYQYR